MNVFMHTNWEWAKNFCELGYSGVHLYWDLSWLISFCKVRSPPPSCFTLFSITSIIDRNIVFSWVPRNINIVENRCTRDMDFISVIPYLKCSGEEKQIRFINTYVWVTQQGHKIHVGQSVIKFWRSLRS